MTMIVQVSYEGVPEQRARADEQHTFGRTDRRSDQLKSRDFYPRLESGSDPVKGIENCVQNDFHRGLDQRLAPLAEHLRPSNNRHKESRQKNRNGEAIRPGNRTHRHAERSKRGMPDRPPVPDSRGGQRCRFALQPGTGRQYASPSLSITRRLASFGCGAMKQPPVKLGDGFVSRKD
jgi:hypothetical protein